MWPTSPNCRHYDLEIVRNIDLLWWNAGRTPDLPRQRFGLLDGKIDPGTHLPFLHLQVGARAKRNIQRVAGDADSRRFTSHNDSTLDSLHICYLDILLSAFTSRRIWKHRTSVTWLANSNLAISHLRHIFWNSWEHLIDSQHWVFISNHVHRWALKWIAYFENVIQSIFKAHVYLVSGFWSTT